MEHTPDWLHSNNLKGLMSLWVNRVILHCRKAASLFADQQRRLSSYCW
jgi:hypothetical protein